MPGVAGLSYLFRYDIYTSVFAVYIDQSLSKVFKYRQRFYITLMAITSVHMHEYINNIKVIYSDSLSHAEI